MTVDHRPHLERKADRLLRLLALAGVAWVALCGLLAALLTLRLTRPQELPC